MTHRRISIWSMSHKHAQHILGIMAIVQLTVLEVFPNLFVMSKLLQRALHVLTPCRIREFKATKLYAGVHCQPGTQISNQRTEQT